MILSCQKGEIMSLLIKTLVINDTNDISKLKELKDKRVKIILLNEKIFIETLRVDKKCNIEEKIEQLISCLLYTSRCV